METQAPADSVACDHWAWPQTGDLEFFRHLFTDRPFQFELGLRRTKRDWFDLPKKRELTVLLERQMVIGGHPEGSVVWSPAADGLYAEMVEQLRPFPGSVTAVELGRMWPPDFILLRPDERGEFRMVGGVVCFPSGWAPEEKMGQRISTIHGPVPGLNNQLGVKIQRFLERLEQTVSFDRLNWGLAPSRDRNRHPANRPATFERDFPIEKAWLRVEHQSFQALAETKGIAFLIHLTIHSMRELLADKGVAGGLLRQLQTMSEEVANYKGLGDVREYWMEWLHHEFGPMAVTDN